MNENANQGENDQGDQTPGERGGQGGSGGQSGAAPHSGGGAAHATGQPQPTHQQAGLAATLSRPEVKRNIKYAVGIFSIVGLGFGLTGFVFNDILLPAAFGTGGEEGASSQSLVDPFFQLITIFGIVIMATLSGSIVGAISSFRVADRIENNQAAYLASGLGNAVGFVAMLVVTVLVLSATVSVGGSGSGTGTSSGGSSAGSLLNLGDLLVPIVALSIPVAIVGLATVVLHRRLDTPSRPEPSGPTAD